MSVYLVLMLVVLLNSAVSQDTSGDHQCGPGQEQCVQNSVERMRYEMGAMQDDLRRLIKENEEITASLERVTRENQQLSTENVLFRKDLQRVIQENQKITADLLRLKNSIVKAGSTYIKWGRTVCRDGSQRLYRGYAAASGHSHPGGGSNYICLHSQPEWGRYTDGFQSYGYIYGIEYHMHSNNPFPKSRQALDKNDAPCAACYTPRSATIMIPARTTCPDGWGKEYGGYVMAEAHHHKGRTTYVCVDGDPEMRPGGGAVSNGAFFFNTEVGCGSIPCPPYVDGREIACVVCSK